MAILAASGFGACFNENSSDALWTCSCHFRAETIKALPLPATAQATPKSLTEFSNTLRTTVEPLNTDKLAAQPPGENPSVSILKPASEIILVSVASVK